MHTSPPARTAEVVAPGSGHHVHFLNHLATIKHAAGPGDALSVVEFTAARGFGPPLHRHLDEDELFVVLEGELAFRSGGQELEGVAGSVALLPAGAPHTFQVLSEAARFTCITASVSGTPRFDRMVTALGVPTDRPTLPEPTYVDASHVADVCLEHGIEILGPPPAPLPDRIDHHEQTNREVAR